MPTVRYRPIADLQIETNDPMPLETVQAVKVARFGRTLQLRLAGGGESWYDTVNYTLVGVEWQNDLGAFGFKMKNRKHRAQWFADVLEELENEIDLRLQLDSAMTWTNVPDEMKREIELALK